MERFNRLVIRKGSKKALIAVTVISRWKPSTAVICNEGGLNEEGQPADTRTYAQKCSLLDLLRQLKTDYPNARIFGHYQLSKSVHKACPCFDAKKEYS